MKKILAIALLAFCVVGCTDFERSTFQTLSASKAVIDTAQADYESRTLPHNSCSYAIINDAKGIQTAAVDSLQVYDKIRVAKGDLTAQTAVVSATLLQLAPEVVKVQALITNPAICGGK